MQDEDGALVEWQPAKRLVQLVTVGDFLHVVHATRHVRVKQMNGRCPSPVSWSVRIARVNKDAKGPPLKVVDVTQVRELPPDRQQGVLQDVLGQTGISEDPPGDAQQRVTDLVHQFRERFLVAGAGSLHHISIQETLREVAIGPPSTSDEGNGYRNRSVRGDACNLFGVSGP